MKKLFIFGKELNNKMKEDRATGLAAEQSYYYTLSLFPLMILILSIIPYLSLSPEQVISTMEELMPRETVALFEDNILDIIENKNGGFLTFGILATIWSASNGMNAFMHSMNVAFDVKETRSFIISRLISILLTFGLIIAFIVVLVLPVFGEVIINVIQNISPLSGNTELLFNVLRWVIAVSIMTIILSALYYIAPDKHYPFKEVIPGAIVATLLWLIISIGFSFYVSNFANYSSTYGGLGGVIVLMLWLYFSGFTFVIGGEINALLHKNKAISTNRTTETKAM